MMTKAGKIRTYLSVMIMMLMTFLVVSVNGQGSDAALRRVQQADDLAKKENGGDLPNMSPAEHLSRADAYMANRLFPQAREHWAKMMANHPNDPGIPKALFGTARSFMWEREYLTAVSWFDKLTDDHLMTKDGREGLAFKGASYVRAGKNLEAAKVYEQYAVMFPAGEKIASAHLNLIDAYREAGKYDKANEWVLRSVEKFSGSPTAVDALQAKVRMEIHRERWDQAVAAADQLINMNLFRNSMSSIDEIRYLKGFALEKAGKKAEASVVYMSIQNTPSSYYGGLSHEKRSNTNVRRTVSGTPKQYSDHPILFRSQVLKHAAKQKIDPRFILAIMKQESSFRPNAKSPAGARGLVQLVFDTALKYKDMAGYARLVPDDLYDPETNIAIGALYIKTLKDEFDGLYEAVAASYNAGEDNAARWLARTRPHDPGIFASEVGFSETKNYVFKVMNNYRIYRELYNEDLQRR